MKLRHLAFLAGTMLAVPAPASNPDPVAYAIERKNGELGDLSKAELQDRLIEAELRLERCER